MLGAQQVQSCVRQAIALSIALLPVGPGLSDGVLTTPVSHTSGIPIASGAGAPAHDLMRTSLAQEFGSQPRGVAPRTPLHALSLAAPPVRVARSRAHPLAVDSQALTLPSYFQSRAGRSPVDVAFLLANASVPSGMEIREADNVYSGDVDDLRLRSAREMSANDFAKLFNAAHGEYRATIVDGVFVIRPVQRPANFLDMPAAIPPQTVFSGPMTAATQLFLPLNPLLNGPVLNARPENTRVVLDGGTTVLRALNQIVQQTRNTWFVVTRKTGDRWTPVAYGFISQGAQRDTRGILSR